MSEEEGQRKPSEREQGGRIDARFVKKPSGYFMIINMFLAFLCMCMMSGWLGDTRYRSSKWNFFMYASTHTWVALLVIIILRLVKVPSYCAVINWDLTYALNAIIFVALMCIGSTLMAIKASGYNISYVIAGVEYSTCSKYSCSLLIVTAYAINCLVCAILFAISSSIVAKGAADFRPWCNYYDCELFTAIACFGFITMVGCMVECFFHFKDWKTSP